MVLFACPLESFGQPRVGGLGAGWAFWGTAAFCCEQTPISLLSICMPGIVRQCWGILPFSFFMPWEMFTDPILLSHDLPLSLAAPFGGESQKQQLTLQFPGGKAGCDECSVL